MMLKRLKQAAPAAGLVFAALIAGAGPVSAQTAPDATVVHPDYADPRLWLCRPGLEDNRCEVNLEATVVNADGRTSVETYRQAEAAAIDCFYLYPTVSDDKTWQSDFAPDKAEWEVTRLQFARFGQVCRQFAPLYRQLTLTRLFAGPGRPAPEGEQPPAGFGGYADVRAAWDWYMAHENHGRGVVLIGHSQGAAMITRLVAEAVDGQPAQAQLVSALIIGAPVMVPAGADVGASFAHVPLCREPSQTGCVISYATYRDSLPPPPHGIFGRARDGLRVACVNPASLAGGSGTPRSYFLTHGMLNRPSTVALADWLPSGQDIETPFVTTPGLVSTECVERGDFNWLSMRVNADPDDPRTDEVGGEIMRADGPNLAWGLHLLDVDHSMGTLIDIVGAQGDRYLRNDKAETDGR